eukprot:403338177
MESPSTQKFLERFLKSNTIQDSPVKTDSNSIRSLIVQDNKDEKQMVEKSQNHLSSQKSLILKNEKMVQTRQPQDKRSFLEYEHQTSMRSMYFQKRNKAEVPLKFRKQNTHPVKKQNSSLGLNSQDELPPLVDHQAQLKQLYQQLQANTELRDQYFQELEMQGQNMQKLSRDIQLQHKSLKSIQDKREAITLMRSGAQISNTQISQKYDQQVRSCEKYLTFLNSSLKEKTEQHSKALLKYHEIKQIIQSQQKLIQITQPNSII